MPKTKPNPKCLVCNTRTKITCDPCNYTQFTCVKDHVMIQCKACDYIAVMEDELPEHCEKCPCLFYLADPDYNIPERNKMPNPLGKMLQKEFKI